MANDRMLTKALVENPNVMAHSCRMRAEEMHVIAGTMRGPAREILERQARAWERLAAVAEQRAASAVGAGKGPQA